MATLVSQIQALITYANEVTGKTDTLLGDAVKTLADGYNGGGGESTLPSGYTDADSLSSQIQALISYANSITGAEDATIGDAVKTLADGYGSVLPSGYTECEYLQSSGTQYIETNQYVYPETRIDLDFLPKSIPSSTLAMYFGLYSTSYGPSLCRWTTGLQGKIVMSRNGNNAYNSATFYDVTSYLTERHLYSWFEDKCYVDDELKATLNSSYNGTSAATLALFVCKNGKSYSFFESLYIYGFHMSTDGVDTINLIPCLDADGVPCMYDTVGKQTLYNQGTGTFGYKTKSGVVVDPT